MRLRKGSIRARVKGDLPIAFSGERISARGGLELFRRFAVAIELPARLRLLFRDTPLEADYGAVRLVMLLIGLLVIGGVRVSLWQEYSVFFTLPLSYLGYAVGNRFGRARSGASAGEGAA